MSASPKARRWFRFSLRTFFIVVTVLCVWLGWRIFAASEQKRFVAAVQRAGGYASYDYEYANGSMPGLEDTPQPGWLGNLLGVDFVYNVVDVGISNVHDREHLEWFLSGLKKLPQLQRLEISACELLDEDLKHLANLTGLQTLKLQENSLTDSGVPYLNKLRGLKQLNLARNNISDQGLRLLESMPELKAIGLYQTRITDAGLRELSRFPKLNNLQMAGNTLTGEGFKDLNLGSIDHCWLSDCPITDEGLLVISAMTKMWWLSIDNTNISDSGFKCLEKLTEVHFLSLTGTQISDESISTLAALPKLVELRVAGTQITSAGIARLQKLRPKLNIDSVNKPPSRKLLAQ